ncbi:MAG: CNNM domain-containing protein [Planctomycetota bacterium]|jgi:CBS domain containing-hemolysin-like protein
MIWLLCIGGFVVFVAASAFFSGTETGIYCVNRLRLRLSSDRGEPRAVRLQRLLEDEQGALATTLLGTNLANYLTTVSLALLLTRQIRLSEHQVEVYTTLIVTPLLFVFGEVLPKNLFQRDADRLLYSVAAMLVAAKRVFAPLVWALTMLSTRLLAAFATSEHRTAGPDDGDHAGRHGEFVDRVLNLPSTPVRAVMIPRDQVISLSADADRQEFLRTARRHAHSRLPVYRRHSGQIMGVVDVHALLADEMWDRVDQRVQPTERLDPDEPVASAILQVQRSGLPMAIVARQQGPLMGIVTLKDLLEEIVGELAAW